MFSFHKPRVYRSTEGCCICRAKSSSSRFTDSRKYEIDSMKCFDLKYPRHGEICNACVLLVKRFKRLPVGSNRHWGHVVDARAGPGTKAQSKHKKYRDDSNEQSGATSASCSAKYTQNNGKSLISEKFSKIFKKSKKINTTVVNSGATVKSENDKHKSSSTSTTRCWDNHSLPTTPDSLDSDYEEHHAVPAASVVQFQTETRASSYRSRNFTGANCTTATQGCNRRRPFKLGSKRRKCLPPCKNRRAYDEVQFFDETEWQERKSCCGMVYECAVLSGALLINLDYYEPCAEHQKKITLTNEKAQHNVVNNAASTPLAEQLALPTAAAIAPQSAAPTVVTVNPTPVLKKHHLFYKRQSECFPHGDVNNYSKGTSADIESTLAATNNSTTTTTTTAMHINASLIPAIIAGSTPPFTSKMTAHSVSRHSTAKVTTIMPNVTAIAPFVSTTSTTASNNSRSHSFLNKIKADTGKIVKHSWDKLNTAVRIKPSDLQEMKHVINAVDKSYVLASAASKANNGNMIIGSQSYTHPHYQHVQALQPLTTATLSAGGSSPTSSSSSSSSTKFSDNSSDSGFDEHTLTLDRKSASPLQEDMERKLLTRPGSCVQTMFLASGVQIQGQHQNLLLTGNEVAAKVLQNRKQQLHPSNGLHQHQPQINRISGTAAGAVKITQIVGASTAGGSHGNMQAIYSSNNTIQHENGVTTIVPASSLAASNQTAAMNAMAPSTVTITPAPLTHHITKKTNLIGFTGSSNNNSSNINTHSNAITNCGINNSSINVSNSSNTNASLNSQKIVLLKTAPTKYNNNSNVAATATKTNTLNKINQSVGKN